MLFLLVGDVEVGHHLELQRQVGSLYLEELPVLELVLSAVADQPHRCYREQQNLFSWWALLALEHLGLGMSQLNFVLVTEGLERLREKFVALYAPACLP